MGNVRRVVRVTTAILFGLACTAYVAAKIDFFHRYGRVGLGSYLRQHSILWAMMLGLFLLIWLLEKIFPENPDR